MTAAPALLPPDGGNLPAGSDPVALAAAATELGLAVCTADCDRARSRSAVLRAVARALDCAEYFGGDAEGLFDCLCDAITEQKTGILLSLHHLHSGDPALEVASAQIDAVCQAGADYARSRSKIFCYHITHAGRHPDPEPGKVTSWSAAGK